MVFFIFDRVYVIEIGEIVFEGKVEDLLYNDRVKKVYFGG